MEERWRDSLPGGGDGLEEVEWIVLVDFFEAGARFITW